MNSRERIKTTLDHQEPDAVPMDFGSTSCTTMHVSCVAALRDHYGLKQQPVKVAEPYIMSGFFDQDLLQAMGCDVLAISNYGTAYGFDHERWKEWDYFGQTVLVPEGFQVTENETGGYDIYPQGDTSVLPAGRMPKNGFFFDAINREPPYEDADDLDYRDNLEEHQLITDEELAYYQREAELAAATDWAVLGEIGYIGLGDVGGISGPGLKHPKGIRSIDGWFMAPILYPEYVHRIFAAQTEIAIENLKQIKNIIGDKMDIYYGCGADFGTQNSLFYSPETFRELWMPYYKKMTGWIHDNTNWKVMKHSCGAIFSFIPLLIEAGFDILNPIQCSAKGMDPQLLKQEYGKDIVFWGGGVDTQKVLPFGTPEEVREQVLRRLEIFAPGGGFVFNSIHNIQYGTPVANIVAMIDAVHEFNGK